MVRVVTLQRDARSSIVTPTPRARSISRRIVHWRITSALRGTFGFYRLSHSVPSPRLTGVLPAW